MNIIAENQTAQADFVVSEYASITVISTAGSTDTTVEAKISATRWALVATITGGVGVADLHGVYSSIRINPGTSAVVDVSGREKH